MMPRKILHWGPYLQEKDGGAVVNHYQTKKMLELAPRDEHYVVPKVPEELDTSMLPSLNYFPYAKPEEVPMIMSRYQIPIVETFHVGRPELEKTLDAVHNIGGNFLLWQTIHWSDDDIFKFKRLNDFDKIIAPTHFALNTFKSITRIPDEKLIYLPHAVDTTRYYKRTTVLEKNWKIDKRSQKVILFSGRLSFWKGVHQIIPIMRKLVNEFNCIFIIRGSAFQGNPESMKLAYIFDRLSTNNPNIIFLQEWQHPDFMEELFAMTDILIFNSAHEGFGVPLIEAMACKAIPLTTAIPNHIEIVGRTGLAGMLLEPKVQVGEVNDGRKLAVASSDQLYGACKWLLENPDEVSIMGERGSQIVNDRYDLTKIAVQWLQLYDSFDIDMDKKILERIEHA
jgi:glycosyltransferase involved in cell wall biosynthesis